MNKEFVPYEEAFALKELDFNEPCLGYYLCRNSAFGINDLEITTERIDLIGYDYASCVVPTFSQAFRWFREKYFMEGFVFMVDCVNKAYEYHIDFTDREDKELYTFEHIPQCFVSENHFSKYPEAELACLNKLIEIVK